MEHPKELIGLALGGQVGLGADSQGKFIQFSIGQEKAWGYSHRLWLTDLDLDRLIEKLKELREEGDGAA